MTRVPELPVAAATQANPGNSFQSPAQSSTQAAAPTHAITKKPKSQSNKHQSNKRRSNDFVEIQTEWIVECDDCGRKHKPDEKLIGKRIKCKCGTVLHLTEHPNASIPLAPLEPEMVDLSQMQPYETHAGPAPVFQAPPPSFKSSPKSIREQRKRDAEEMVRAADQKQQWRSTLKDDDGEEEWGPLGKVIGGGAMIAGGGVWAFLAWQAGYIYPYSFILMGLGALSVVMGLIESAG